MDDGNETPIATEDAALLSRVLLWRVSRARPADPPAPDVQVRLEGAGASFRARARPLTLEELVDALRRLQAWRPD